MQAAPASRLPAWPLAPDPLSLLLAATIEGGGAAVTTNICLERPARARASSLDAPRGRRPSGGAPERGPEHAPTLACKRERPGEARSRPRPRA